MNSRLHCVRVARLDDVPRLPELERAAAMRFERIGMPEVAKQDPVRESTLGCALREGCLLVAVDLEDAPVGFALCSRVDDGLHLDELSVHPAHGGRGFGARLLGAVETLAVARDFPAITLVTFRDVAWNAPWYRRHGFVELPLPTLRPGLRARWSEEAVRGFDPGQRLCMGKRVHRPAARAQSGG